QVLIHKTVDDGLNVRTDMRMIPPGDRPYLGKPEWILDGRQKTRILYNAQGQPTETEIYDLQDTLLASTSATYNKDGRLACERDALGAVTCYLYDENGNCVYKRSPDYKELCTY